MNTPHTSQINPNTRAKITTSPPRGPHSASVADPPRGRARALDGASSRAVRDRAVVIRAVVLVVRVLGLLHPAAHLDLVVELEELLLEPHIRSCLHERDRLRRTETRPRVRAPAKYTSNTGPICIWAHVGCI